MSRSATPTSRGTRSSYLTSYFWDRNLYANSLSSIDVGPAYSAYDGNGVPLAGATVNNGEAGVRLDLFKSKLLVNVAAFTMTDKDRPVNFGAAIQNLLVSPTGTLNGSGFSAFVMPSTDISKYTGSAFVRYEFNETFLKNTRVMLAAKHLGRREAELISMSTATGDITVDRRLVPAHYLYDFNMGYRRKIGRYSPTFQLNVSNVADDDKFYGAVWQTGRTYRLSAGVNF
ncbi:MAG: hypothetical protein EXS37_04655 [Opitutus sp.]|nr:hypothetical protein [Opitutus sp.]